MLHFLSAKRLVTIVLTAALLTPALVHAGEKSPADAVKAFNTAINQKNLDAVTAALAEGGVNFTLRAAHPGMSSDMPLTGDLIANWKTVAAVLFSTTESYTRDVEITNIIEDGDIATVWADATTTSVRNAGEDTRVNNFSELYVVVKRDGAWEIGAYLDNRAVDSLIINGDDE